MVVVISSTPGVLLVNRGECRRVEGHRLNVDDLVGMEAGHVGGELWAGHALPGELFGVGTGWVADQRDESIRAVASLGPHTVGGDPECLEGCQVAGPVNRRVLLQSFGRSQGVDPELKHRMSALLKLMSVGVDLWAWAWAWACQIISATHRAASARPCSIARASMIESHFACSARPFGSDWLASAAAVSCRLIGALTCV